MTVVTIDSRAFRMSNTSRPDPMLLELAADIVSAYVIRNAVPASELPALIRATYASIAGVETGSAAPVVDEVRQPPMPISKSITDEYIICFEDNKRFKSLKRHLQVFAPAYSRARSDSAKKTGLGVNHPGSRARLQAEQVS